MTKKIAALFLAVMMLFGITMAFAEAPLAGGWTVLEDRDSDDKIEDRAENALKKALAGMTGATYDEEAVLGYQVVSGTNYCILCRVTPVVPNAVSHWALVYVYEDLQGNCSILAVQDVELGVPAAE